MIFWRAEGEVIDRGGYWLVRTPSNPTYYGGNLLVFNRPPVEGDYNRWLEMFRSEFEDQPEVRHLLFMWDVEGDETGVIAPFQDGGFEVQTNLVLLAESVHPPPKTNHEMEVRALKRDAEWEQLLETKVRLRDPKFDLRDFTLFKRRWLDVRRELALAGRGNWYGAFLDGRMVGNLGLFHEGALARFQDVDTEPDFRRRGICGTLVYEVAKEALASGGIETLVMVADENYHAARIYESVGFKPRERHISAIRYPRKK